MRRIRIKENNKNNELTKEEVDESNDIELEKISKGKLFDTFYNFSTDICSFILSSTLFIFTPLKI